MRRLDNRNVFVTLPWLSSPDWIRFLNLVEAKIGKIPKDHDNSFHIIAEPSVEEGHLQWCAVFDFLSYGKRVFFWSGTGLENPEKSIKEQD